MTNEELASRIKAGERELAGELWAQVERLLGVIVNRYITRLGDLVAAAGVEREDLEQEAYFAMLGAVKAYDPAKGYAFNSYLALQCQKRFFSLLGLRGRREPLNACASLDEPASNDEDDDRTRADIIPSGEDMEADTVERLWLAQLRADLDAALSKMDELEADCIRRHYLDEQSKTAIADTRGMSPQSVFGHIDHGLRELRSRSAGVGLHKYRDDIIGRCAYSGSLGSWRYTGTSSTERTALKLFEAEEEYSHAAGRRVR